jgi:hypothetical protein
MYVATEEATPAAGLACAAPEESGSALSATGAIETSAALPGVAGAFGSAAAAAGF